MRRPALLLALLCLGAAAEETPKDGVDPALQKQIDAAVAKGRAWLERTCLEGEIGKPPTPQSLRLEAEDCRKQAEAFRKQAAALKHGASSAKGLKETQAALEAQIQAAEKKEKSLLQQADRLEHNPPPQKEVKRRPAQASSFPHGAGELALIGLALVQSGLQPSDPLLEGIWDVQRGLKPADFAKELSLETYTRGVGLMFADAMMHAREAWPPAERRALHA